jgi:hypothetical protein
VRRTQAGWGWTARLRHADILTLPGIVTPAICSVPGLLAVMPVCWRSGQRMLFAVCGLEGALIVRAAPGLVRGGHQGRREAIS